MRMKLPVTDLAAGESGPVVEILGGFGLRGRLLRMGIREGARLTMVGPPSVGGPVVLLVAGSQVALGFGMAAKILVEVDRA